ncbi:MAG: hypothetical protein NT027_06530, partial [Proteobacteria bacterium]|nr:hypothetical protein [Pseudomonadota bacterium]
IVLSHRKSGPKIDGPEFGGLAIDEFERIVFLSAILRLASALNRSRQGLVKAVEIQAHGDVAIRILSKSRRKDSLHVEFLQLERELDEIGKAFRRKFLLDKDEGVVRIVKTKKSFKRVRKRNNISKGAKIKTKKLIRSSLLLAKKVVKNTTKKSVKKATKKK